MALLQFGPIRRAPPAIWQTPLAGSERRQCRHHLLPFSLFLRKVIVYNHRLVWMRWKRRRMPEDHLHGNEVWLAGIWKNHLTTCIMLFVERSGILMKQLLTE